MDGDGGDVKQLPPRRSPFGALVAAACHDPGAAQGLAAAYVALEPPHRRRMVEAVCRDARAEGEAPAVALAPLLGVENDPAIARAIARAMEEDGGRGLGTETGARALLAGTDERGTAALIRPLYGRFVELLGLSWDVSGVTLSRFEPLLDGQRIDAHLAEMPDAPGLRESPFGHGVQRVTEVLWRHLRRHGCLPSGLGRFADVL